MSQVDLGAVVRVGANRQCAPPFGGPAPETGPILVEEAPGNVAERLRATEELNRSLREEIRELRDRLDAETAYLQKSVLRGEGFDEIVGVSAALSKVLHQVEQVAGTDSPVLILGETGTGKELVAHAVHDRSRRSDRPLVILNCAALPDALVESELFGYEKGAFTGAAVRTLGRFEMAHGGTILLDEIGEMPLGAQAKMLRVLEGGTFERLGSSRTIKVGRAGDRRDESRPRQGGARRTVPRRPLLPPQRLSPDHPAPARACRGRARPRLAFHQRQAGGAGAEDQARAGPVDAGPGDLRLAGEHPRARERDRACLDPQQRSGPRQRRAAGGSGGRDRFPAPAWPRCSALTSKTCCANATGRSRARATPPTVWGSGAARSSSG